MPNKPIIIDFQVYYYESAEEINKSLINIIREKIKNLDSKDILLCGFNALDEPRTSGSTHAVSLETIIEKCPDPNHMEHPFFYAENNGDHEEPAVAIYDGRYMESVRTAIMPTRIHSREALIAVINLTFL